MPSKSNHQCLPNWTEEVVGQSSTTWTLGSQGWGEGSGSITQGYGKRCRRSRGVGLGAVSGTLIIRAWRRGANLSLICTTQPREHEEVTRLVSLL
jgi:hypothetical protein